MRDVERSVDFYGRVFGFEVVAREAGGRAAFLRAGGGSNHHDLGLFEVGASASSPGPGTVGLYHLAWEVESFTDLMAARDVLASEGALGGQSDHGATKSLYGADPDGNEFEIMWMVPRSEWGEHESSAIVAPLDIAREAARWS